MIKLVNSLSIRIHYMNNSITWYWAALDKRIASFVTRTTADGIVVDNSAFGILSTDSSAGIFTLLIDTSLSRLAIGIEETFGPATGWNAQISGLTRASWTAIDFTTDAIRTCFRSTKKFYNYKIESIIN